MQYTYIVNSNATLLALVNGVAGNDYRHVLIKTGTWSATASRTGGNWANPTPFIDIVARGIRSITGEPGSVIELTNSATAGNSVAGIKGPGELERTVEVLIKRAR